MSRIHGLLLDSASRCQHYHGKNDILALKCFQCQKFYACYSCHNSLEDHDFSPYPLKDKAAKPVICGVCRTELTFEDYQKNLCCPNCQSAFNPACQKHYHLYFK